MADEVDKKDKDSERDERDPLSFFAAGDDSSSSDSDSDKEDNQRNVNQGKNNDTNNSKDLQGSIKLPSPHTLFATVGRPSFLNTNQEESAVDWDKLSTKYNPAIYASAPVVSLEEREKDDTYSDAMISSNPIKYGKELSEIQKHIVIHGKRGSDIRLMTHRESSEQNTGESSAKKAKTAETFKQKEKRKRDLGQATKDKSYVEEEKRVLREGFDTE